MSPWEVALHFFAGFFIGYGVFSFFRDMALLYFTRRDR